MSADALSDRTADLLCLADVHRWNVVKTVRSQSVAEHSFAVAVIAMEICERLGVYPTATVMWHALTHDMPEVLTGDIDGKFKRDNPEVKAAIVAAEKRAFPDLSRIGDPGVEAVVKLADKIEGLAWISVWGHGPRADDIKRELHGILYNEVVPAVAIALRQDEPIILAITRQIHNHSVFDSNCIQVRRHRK